jgi:hypothetical protein
MSSLSRQQRTTRMHDNSSLVHVITRIHHDYEHSDVSREKMSIFSEKLDRLWSNLPARLVNIEGYHVVDYLERLLIDEKIQWPRMFTSIIYFSVIINDFMACLLVRLVNQSISCGCIQTSIIIDISVQSRRKILIVHVFLLLLLF